MILISVPPSYKVIRYTHNSMYYPLYPAKSNYNVKNFFLLRGGTQFYYIIL